MIISKNIFFKEFNSKAKFNEISKYLKKIIDENNEILKSLRISYKDKFNKKLISKLKKIKKICIIGMGGSILGSKAIHSFLFERIKKELFFIDNLNFRINKNILKKKKVNLIISKSGNTLETISNSSIILNKKDENIFIVENKNNYLLKLANKLKAEIVHHNNYIGGRYSVLSEVGMLPSALMGLEIKKFRKFNNLIKNKRFLNAIVKNVANQLEFIKKKKNNSIILNYDEKSIDLFNWYQQLMAESLGKNNTGVLPIISSMPKDNHSMMQYYLDGPKNYFFTFFIVKEKYSQKLSNKNILNSRNYLKNKSFRDIIFSQFTATQKVFKKKKIPFRTFVINNRNEETLGELFTFFMLEVILLGKFIKNNPFNQPEVELIKSETNKLLI